MSGPTRSVRIAGGSPLRGVASLAPAVGPGAAIAAAAALAVAPIASAAAAVAVVPPASAAMGVAVAPVASVAATQAATHLLVIGGIGGDDAHREKFTARALSLLDAARDRYGVPEGNVRYLAEREELAPGRVAARSTRDNVEAAFADLASRTHGGDQVLVVLIGHGSARDGEARFNLPGPDMAASDFAPLLDALPGRRIAFVNTTSSSGGFVGPLAGPDRVIVTATRTVRESNEAVFGDFFVEAFAGDGADQDKDERVSILEAFQYASREVQRFYEADGRLLTEHAILEDNGDGEGTGEPEGGEGDGSLARSVVLGAPLASRAGVAGAEGATDDPELARLYEGREAAQQRLDEHRAAQATMDEEEYLARLEALLLEIARIDRQIRERRGDTR